MINELLDIISSKQEAIVSTRRYLHQHPELSFQELETAKYISKFYERKDCEVETGVGGNGVVVTIHGKNPGKTVAIRADFDALPIQEETNLPFKSVNDGVMHACGHDGHTAIMLQVADSLIQMKDHFDGTIKIIHQHAEELPPGGAISMIKDGVLDGVDAFFGLHLISTMPFGSVFYRAKETQAGRASFKILLTGKGSHGSEPHHGNDAIVAASHLVLELQNIVSRRVRPGEMAVVTIGSFDGKGAPNIIKEKVELQGDVRFMKTEVGETIKQEFVNITEGIAKSFSLKVDLSYENDYPALYNDPQMTEIVRAGITNLQSKIENLKEVVETPALSNSEDASYYLQKVAGSYFYVGASKVDGPTYPHHNPKFDINEDAMMIAAKAYVGVLAEYFGWQ